MELTLKIELLSDTIIGTGVSEGAVIDTEVVYDYLGLPYIPAKRIKGLLHKSSIEVLQMFQLAGILKNTSENVDNLYGKAGDLISSPVIFSNCYITSYEEIKPWINWLESSYKNYFSKDSVINFFTSIRHSTAIDSEGIAKNHSLRSYRVLIKGLEFCGKIQIIDELQQDNLSLLSLSVQNLRYIGINKNRGCGNIKCQLFEPNGVNLCEKYLGLIKQEVEGKI